MDYELIEKTNKKYGERDMYVREEKIPARKVMGVELASKKRTFKLKPGDKVEIKNTVPGGSAVRFQPYTFEERTGPNKELLIFSYLIGGVHKMKTSFSIYEYESGILDVR
jgi:hypothetical protein